MNEREARDIIRWAKECNKRDQEQDRLFLPTVREAIGYLKCYERAKVLEESIIELHKMPSGKESVEHFYKWFDKSKEALAKWEKEK